MRSLLVGLLVLLFPAVAVAADLTVTVRDAAGAPAANAVIMVYPVAGLPPGPIHFPWPLEVEQKNIAFNPFVLVAPVGAQVRFPNRDKVRHHVYSFSAGNRFELKLFGQDETRSVTFKAVGVAAIGCNIHDQMVGFIQVVDTPYAIKTGPDGVAVVRGAPAGAARLRVWHPYLKAPKNEVARQITIGPGGGREAFTLDIRAPAQAMPGMAH